MHLYGLCHRGKEYFWHNQGNKKCTLGQINYPSTNKNPPNKENQLYPNLWAKLLPFFADEPNNRQLKKFQDGRSAGHSRQRNLNEPLVWKGMRFEGTIK